MQQIEFTSDRGTIVINDCGTSAFGDNACDLWLNDFDGNSLALTADTVRCVDFPGQKLIGAVANPRTITAKIGFMPKSLLTEETKRHELRILVLKQFSPGTSGTLHYRNNAGEWSISVRISEMPSVTYTAGMWAESTVYFTADYPYWEYPAIDSEWQSVSSGGITEITPEEHGDIDSPIEFYFTATANVSGFSFGLKSGSAVNYYYQIRCNKSISSGTELKYVIGVGGEYGVYVKDSSGSWAYASEYQTYRDYEDAVFNKVDGTPFAIKLDAGGALCKIVYHNIAVAV